MAENTKVMPTGVKVISVLEYIGSGLAALFGLMLIIGANLMGAWLPEMALFGAGIVIFIGILILGIAVLEFFIARGLWRGQQWARIILIVFSTLGVLFSLIGLFGETPGQSAVSLIINGAIAGYLWFAPEVKTAFA